jgi:hypothetical protein
VVYLLDWAQTCSATYDACQWFVYNWGVVPALYLRYTGFLNIPLLSSLIGAIVQVRTISPLSYIAKKSQIFYGWRIWILSGSKIFFVLICVLAFVQLGGGIATAFYVSHIHIFRPTNA